MVTRGPNHTVIRMAIGFANLIAFFYFITSAVVVINAFVWLPTFPDFWYTLQRIIYWPWQPYFDLVYALLGRSSISYGAYAILTRVPFLVIPLVIMGLTLSHLCSGCFIAHLLGRRGLRRVTTD